MLVYKIKEDKFPLLYCGEIMKKIFCEIIKFRYYIATMSIIIGIIFNFHGSSIGVWNSFGIRETISGNTMETTTLNSSVNLETFKLWVPKKKSDGTIIGVPRDIRSDEWRVQTPLYFSQASSDFSLINDNYAFSGQNMVVAYNAPVKHISIIGKPFNWGFLFLGMEKGLSWYWCFKIITFLLLAYEFSMILTKKNKLLSVVGSIWITFTPAIQWWFMQHLGDVVYFSLLLMVSIYHYFRQKKSYLKVMFACLIGISIIGFTLVIYPAFQVPFAYVILSFVILEFCRAWNSRIISKFDFINILSTLIISFTIIVITLYSSLDAIIASLETVYPGSRISVGGELKFDRLSDFLLNIMLPFKIPSVANQVELSTSLHFLYFIFPSLPFVIKSKSEIKENIFGITLIIFSGLLTIFTFVSVSEVLSKVTLFSFVTSGRAWQMLSILAVFISLWFASLIWNKKDELQYRYFILIIIIINLGLVYSSISNQFYIDYLGRKVIILMLALFTILFVLMLYKKKLTFSILMIAMCSISGLTVNPLVQGIGSIDDKILSVKVKEIVSRNPDVLWMSDSTELYHFVQMHGAKSIDGVRFSPDKKLMKKLDNENKMEGIWNRYSHLRYQLSNEETIMNNPSPDITQVNLSIEDFDKLNIRYVLTTRPLSDLFGENFKLIHSDSDNNRIYEYQD